MKCFWAQWDLSRTAAVSVSPLRGASLSGTVVRLLLVCVVGVLVGGVYGCGSDPSTHSELDAFNRAGPIEPELDRDKISTARSVVGEYQIDIGDQIEIYAPQVVATLSNRAGYASDKVSSFVTRVDDEGYVTLPMLGRLTAANMTLRDFESKLQKEFSPKYFALPPAVTASVTEHRKYQVRITGAVKEPGVYELRRDEMSLASILTKAKGVKEAGAGVVRMTSSDEAGGQTQIVMLPVQDMDIPFVDAPLAPGMTVAVEQLPRRQLTVFGLVFKPGVFDYPVDVEYSLAQALALAGGTMYKSDPRRATVYRVDKNGNLVAAVFDIGGEKHPEFAGIMLKPGDVVAIQPTVYTTLRQVLPDILKFTIGVNTKAVNVN
jgi:protein involved in polysaccharide export with SLBB domain